MKYVIENGEFAGNYKETETKVIVLRHLRHSVVDKLRIKTTTITTPSGKVVDISVERKQYREKE